MALVSLKHITLSVVKRKCHLNIYTQSRSGSRINEKGFHMYKGVGVRFAGFIYFFLKYPMKMKYFGVTETKLFHFHRIFNKKPKGQRSLTS